MKALRILTYAQIGLSVFNAVLAATDGNWVALCAWFALTMLCATILSLVDRVRGLEQELGGAKLEAFNWRLAYDTTKDKESR